MVGSVLLDQSALMALQVPPDLRARLDLKGPQALTVQTAPRGQQGQPDLPERKARKASKACKVTPALPGLMARTVIRF